MLAARYAVRHLTRIPRNAYSAHLITFKLGRVESRQRFAAAAFIYHPHRAFAHNSTMASLDVIIQSLAALSIQPAAPAVAHATTNSPATWREALVADASAPKSFELIKTLVYKPKTAKAATPVPVVVIARDETETSSGAIGKKLNLKELRLASEDLLTEFFALDKNSRMILVEF